MSEQQPAPGPEQLAAQAHARVEAAVPTDRSVRVRAFSALLRDVLAQQRGVR